jgi:hypothetical protein
LFLLGLVLGVEGDDVLVVEFECMGFSTSKFWWEVELLEKIGIWNDVFWAQLKIKVGKSALWKFHLHFTVDEDLSLLAFAGLDIGALRIDIFLAEWTFIEIFDDGEGLGYLRL